MDLHARVEGIFLAHLFLHILTNSKRYSSVNFFVLIALDVLVLVASDLFQLIFLGDEVAFVADRLIAVVSDSNILVSLRVDEYLLFTLLVFDPKLVKPTATF